MIKELCSIIPDGDAAKRECDKVIDYGDDEERDDADDDDVNDDGDDDGYDANYNELVVMITTTW